jgi:hypothetical protein
MIIKLINKTILCLYKVWHGLAKLKTISQFSIYRRPNSFSMSANFNST